MNQFFDKYPTGVVTRILLIVGLVIFLPVYVLNSQVTLQVLDLESMNKLLLSFNQTVFESILTSLQGKGSLRQLAAIYELNIVSTTGFLLFTFSLLLIIARKLRASVFFMNIRYIFPLLVVGITVFDVIPSILFIYLSNDTTHLNATIVFTIDAFYVLRMVLIYIVVLWILLAGVFWVMQRIRKKPREEAN